MAAINFSLLSLHIFLCIMKKFKYIFLIFVSLAPINLILTFIYENDKFYFAMTNSIIGISSFFAIFLTLSLFLSAIYVYSSSVLRAEIKLRTFSPSQSAKRYFRSGDKLK